MKTLARVVPVGLALAAAGLAFAATHRHGLVGTDTYPILATSRVSSPGDLGSILGTRLMGGRYPGDFYRPILSLGFALDAAVWGLDPAGYQLSSALLFGLSALVVFVLARGLIGGDALLGPVVATFAFVLHPTHVEVLSVPARRSEMLCWIFMGLALALQARPHALEARRPPVAPALLGFLAMASKETGLLVPAFAFLVVLLFAPEGGLGARLRRATWAVLPHAVAVAAMVAIRFAVLGGLGGHHVTGPAASITRLPLMFMADWAFLVGPQPVARAGEIGGAGVAIWTAAFAVGCAASAVWVLRARPDLSRVHRTCALSLVWLLAIAAIYAVSGGIQAWYMFLPVAGFSILIGALASLAKAEIRAGNPVARLGGGTLVLAIAALALWQGPYSPLVRRYDAWDRATRVSAEYLGELSSRVDAASDGAVIASPPVPRWVPVEPGRPSVRGASLLADYSIQAWLDLRFPSRRIRVTASAAQRPAEGESLVVVAGDLPGYSGSW